MRLNRTVVVAGWSAFLFVTLAGASRATAQDSIQAVKELYASAAYEDALTAVGKIDSPAEPNFEAEQYRVFCLVALGRMNRFTRNNGHPVKFISPDANKLLCEYSWPGNVRELENVIERLVVTGRSESVMPEHLPMEVRSQQSIGLRPKKERRRTVADDLYKKLVEERESFWTVVYPLYMQREITRGNVRDLVRKGLEDARGNYKIVAKLFNMESRDYKRFLNFLRKHDCQLPFKEYRQ